jgi:hypothetical protein
MLRLAETPPHPTFSPHAGRRSETPCAPDTFAGASTAAGRHRNQRRGSGLDIDDVGAGRAGRRRGGCDSGLLDCRACGCRSRVGRRRRGRARRRSRLIACARRSKGRGAAIGCRSARLLTDGTGMMTTMTMVNAADAHDELQFLGSRESPPRARPDCLSFLIGRGALIFRALGLSGAIQFCKVRE